MTEYAVEVTAVYRAIVDANSELSAGFIIAQEINGERDNRYLAEMLLRGAKITDVTEVKE